MINKRILILEVNEKNAQTLISILKKDDFEAVPIFDKKEFLKLKDEIKNFELIFVNTQVEYITFSDLFELVNGEHRLGDTNIPIVFIEGSKKQDLEALKESLRLGAADYIKKPFDKKEILTRIGYHYNQYEKMYELQSRVDKLTHLATLDPLSKSSSKLHMQALLKHHIRSSNRYNSTTSLVYMSLINVDKLVGIFGFERGEKYISGFSKELKSLLRESDVMARWAGSDFLLLLTNTDVKSTKTVVRKINTQMSSVEILKNTKPRMAFAITEIQKDDTLDDIIQRLKVTLKEAKKQEYDRILVC